MDPAFDPGPSVRNIVAGAGLVSRINGIAGRLFFFRQSRWPISRADNIRPRAGDTDHGSEPAGFGYSIAEQQPESNRCRNK